jgi:hypothetical protein
MMSDALKLENALLTLRHFSGLPKGKYHAIGVPSFR